MTDLRRCMLVLLMAVSVAAIPSRAAALCGDVTGEGNATTTDALLVLKLAVGQSVDLKCDVGRLDSELPSNYGSINLTSGFVPDPASKSVTAGGTIHVDFLGLYCDGYVTSQPDFRVYYSADGASLLRFYYVSSGDTTMIVNDPHGFFSQCGDNSYATNNPTVDYVNPVSGAYDIWIGTLNDTDRFAGTLYITELSGNHP